MMCLLNELPLSLQHFFFVFKTASTFASIYGFKKNVIPFQQKHYLLFCCSRSLLILIYLHKNGVHNIFNINTREHFLLNIHTDFTFSRCIAPINSFIVLNGVQNTCTVTKTLFRRFCNFPKCYSNSDSISLFSKHKNVGPQHLFKRKHSYSSKKCCQYLATKVGYKFEEYRIINKKNKNCFE